MTATTPHVVIDVSAALTQRAGIARYVRGLTEAMVAMDPTERGFTVGTYSHSWKTPGKKPFGVAHVGTWLSPRQWRAALLVGHLTHLPVLPGNNIPNNATFLATDLAFPFAPPERVVVTVHDLTAITHPKVHTPLTRWFAGMMVRQLRRQRHRIVAVSQRTARDLQRVGGIDPSLISVIYPGVGNAFLTVPTESEVSAVLASLNIRPPFVLAVGT